MDREIMKKDENCSTKPFPVFHGTAEGEELAEEALRQGTGVGVDYSKEAGRSVSVVDEPRGRFGSPSMRLHGRSHILAIAAALSARMPNETPIPRFSSDIDEKGPLDRALELMYAEPPRPIRSDAEYERVRNGRSERAQKAQKRKLERKRRKGGR